MKSLTAKSIVIVIIAILTSTNIFSQNEATTTYVDKAEFFEGQKRNNVKINFVGNFIGTTKITVEHITKPGRSFEVKGILVDGGEQAMIAAAGYKFYSKPTFVAPGMQRRNIMEGTYFKPEIFVGMGKDETVFDAADEMTAIAGLVLNIGKQWVIAKTFVIDTYVGTGVGTGGSFRGYIVGEGLVLTGGINFGFAF